MAALAAGAAATGAVLALTPLSEPSARVGAVWAAAGNDRLGAGSGCDHDGLGTVLRTAFAPAVGYTVVAVEVNGVNSGCAGHHVSVTLSGGSGPVGVPSQPVSVPPGGGTVTVPLVPVAVAEAARVDVLVD
jgi:hypothetical protein